MRRIWIAGLALLLVAGLAAFAFGDDDDYHRGPGMMGGGMMGPGMMGGGMMGPGMMGGGMMGGGMMGPGMMGGGMMGPGMMGGGMMGWALGDELTPEQVDKLEEIHFNTMRSMRAMMYENRDGMMAMQKAMTAFPVDQKAALAQWQAMNQTRQTMFSLHLGALGQAQQVIGKEKWEEMMSRFGGPGSGKGSGMMRNR